jgi:hypothetical protein
MKRFHREQPMVEDVMFVPVVKQVEMPYRGNEGGVYEVDNLPVDTMEGLEVSEWIPEGFYGEPVKTDAAPDGGEELPEVSEEEL